MAVEVSRDESSIFEIAEPLIQRWKLLAIGLVIALIAAIIFFTLSPKQYETTLLLQVGSVVERQLEDPYTVVQLINTAAFRQKAALKAGLNKSSKELEKMIQATGDPARPSSIIPVFVQADEPEKAVRLAQAVADGIIERHTPSYNQRIKYHLDFRKDLEARVEEFSKQVSETRKELESLRSAGDFSVLFLTQSKLYDQETQLLTLKRELRDLQGFLSRPQTRQTTIVAAPLLPVKPVKPKLLLNLAVAAFGSLVLMSCYILILDYYRRSRLSI